MHELSIAASVVRTVADAMTERAPGRAVRSVQLRVGVLSGVVPQALGFAWDVAASGTALAGARLDVEPVPVRTSCRACGVQADLPEPLPVRCPGCTGREVDVIGGRELEIATIEVDDVEDIDSDDALAVTA
jgi:hydrogenase nickel incorporation protein HypA/HybF